MRDEYRALLPGAATDALAELSFLLSEFPAREKPGLQLPPLEATAHIHGHCQQKAFGAFPAALDTLRQIPNLTAKPIASSCCGMAGVGYQSETQEQSRAMAEAGLLPAIRAALPEDCIIADGTSCRHQIRDFWWARSDPLCPVAGTRAGMTPEEVLDFWFVGDPATYRKEWFEKHDAFDAACQRFADALRDAKSLLA